MRAAFLLVLAGCAAAPPAAPAELRLEAPLRASNAYASFHYVGELKDAKTTVRIELGYKAPDRGFLRYGPSYAIYYAGGAGHYYFKRGYLKFDAGAVLARLKTEYAGIDIGGEPGLSFGLSQWDALLVSRGLKATLNLQRGPRLGWLGELGGWTVDGDVLRREPVEIQVRPDGFIERMKAGAVAELTRVESRINEPLDDALFEPPPREGLPDLPANAHEELVRAFEDTYRRWAIETDASNRTLEALVAADLERLYEPSKMVAIQKESVDKALETWKTENKEARKELLREKLEIDKGKTLGHVDLMEKDIQLNFERALDRSFRLMPVPPPRAFMRDVADRWSEAVTRVVRRRIRDPIGKIFDDRLGE